MSCNLIVLPGMEAMEGFNESLRGSTGHLGCIVFAYRPGENGAGAVRLYRGAIA
jgi:hypothetical protein